MVRRLRGGALVPLALVALATTLTPEAWGHRSRAWLRGLLPGGPPGALGAMGAMGCEACGEAARRSLAAESALAEERELRLAAESRAAGLSAVAEVLPEVPAALRLAAEVTLRDDSSPFSRTIWIDRGTEQGVAEGQPVLSGRALVGRVLAAGPWTAQVRTVLDPRLAVRVVDGRSRVEGVARGAGAEALRVDLVRRGADVAEGDPLVTGGPGGFAPAGLLVGRVTRNARRTYGDHEELEAAPAAEPALVDRVVVLLLPEGGR
ncbi:MAG: hypothetical protein HY722_13710 [Planctomycetes bacterium]|nr:hypothetical protein [Planctomycetota bacterium]